MEKYISLKHIDKVYDKNVQAVYDFNLDISRGEFVVFVGPSGCGKSTTLRMIAGLEDISAGELLINNVYVNDKPAKDRDVTMVFQNYALFPYMNVYDNIAFGLQIKHKPKAEIKEKVLAAAKILQLENYLNVKPRSLSGGQRQRVALGRAIVSDASIFLMDEPLSNLDAKLRVQMRSEIIRIHQQMKATTIYVTHDQTEAMTMADRIVVMKDGYIQQIGTPNEIYSRPSNTFVATFIGAPTMNLINAKYLNGKIYFENGIEFLFDKETHDAFYLKMISETKSAISKLEIELENTTKEIDISKINSKKLKLKNNLNEYINYLNEAHNVILGIRPEDIHLTDDIVDSFKIEVSIAELLGKEYYIHSDFQGIDLIFKLANDKKVQQNQVINVSFDKNKIHIFDSISLNRIEK